MRAAELLAKMAELIQQGTPFASATITDAKGSCPRGVGTRMLILRDGTTIETIGGGALEKQVVADALACLDSACSRSQRYELRMEGEQALGSVCGGEVTVFLEVHAPDRTLLIVGAGHVGRELCLCAKQLGYRVAVLDLREDMVTRERFPQADLLVCGDPARAAGLFEIDERTHVVIVTHGHQHDQEALRSVIGSSAAYVGMIGSAAKVRTVFAQLAEEGVAPALLSRVHAPIGLDIGAQTPAELALCIMAEIVADGYGKLAGLRTPSAVEARPDEGGASS